MGYKLKEGIFYAKSDEWVSLNEDIATVGISDYAQDKLGDIVYLEEVTKGKKVKQGEVFTTIESVKAASDLNAPVSGEVIEVNADVVSTPSIINQDPYDKGWIVKIKVENPSEVNNLMSDKEYSEYRKE
ncbi:MAG: glycine cleavage system protein GcvH [Caldisericaceae bacterium]|nr:glycine cleavage system protein GcvH [Caldisericaceae bacterium]RLD18547.1 MAG: glycine cleavage system protein GcvH [Caldisericota bacterium]